MDISDAIDEGNEEMEAGCESAREFTESFDDPSGGLGDNADAEIRRAFDDGGVGGGGTGIGDERAGRDEVLGREVRERGGEGGGESRGQEGRPLRDCSGTEPTKC